MHVTVSIHWCACPCGAVHVHVLQFASMRFNACPRIFLWDPRTG